MIAHTTQRARARRAAAAGWRSAAARRRTAAVSIRSLSHGAVDARLKPRAPAALNQHKGDKGHKPNTHGSFVSLVSLVFMQAHRSMERAAFVWRRALALRRPQP